MRVKTEEKRLAIIAMATKLFNESGFNETPMTEIANKLGFSKATLYNYFETKESLYIEAKFIELDAAFDAAHDSLKTPDLGFDAAIRIYAESFLRFLYSPNVIIVRRMIVAEGARSGTPGDHWQARAKKGAEVLAEFFALAISSGALRAVSPTTAASHFCSLLDAELQNVLYYGDVRDLSDDEFRDIAARAIDAFCNGYASKN